MSLSFFNFSLKKLLSTEPDSFSKARIKILYAILVLSLVKVFVAIATSIYHGQYIQLGRAVGILLVYAILLKLLLTSKKYFKLIAHIMIWIGLILIWTNVLILVQGSNIVTIQFLFMVILSSFYLLNNKLGILYSTLSTFPVIISLLTGNRFAPFDQSSEVLASPGFEIIAILNFLTFIYSHFLFHQAFSSNVEEKEKLNNQLQKAVELANQAAQSKSYFLSTMSHELRTPLNSVIGMSELLLDDPHDEEQMENLKILHFSATNLHTIINDILDFNKLDSEKLQLETISVNLYELLNNICLGLRLQATEKGLVMELQMDELLKERNILTDPKRISQIIYNLVGNAIKFTSKGTVSVSLKVISTDDDNINIGFEINDTGIGIDANKHNQIFEAFTQASKSTTRTYGGTGLGLAIVKKLLSLFNSEIVLKSSPGTGSDFSFGITFPIDKQPAAIDHLLDTIKHDLNGLRVLVAEDNSMNRLLLKKVFSKWNNEPDFAENGQEAINKFSANVYDVVLMDIHMPEVDGYEAAKAIRQVNDPIKASVPIIAVTASVSNNISEKIQEAGMNDYIYKPFNTKALYNRLKDIPILVFEHSNDVEI